MKNIKNHMILGAVALMALGMGVSCVSEAPFESAGEGNLHLSATLNGETVTRGEIDPLTMESLREKAVIYVEKKAGTRHEVVRKYKGLDNVPASISLTKGTTYLAEGWTGDSVSASFSAKFYRGKTSEFVMEDESSILLKCNIANVLVSIAEETFDMGLSDVKMTVGHSRGELEFSAAAEGGSTLRNTGYFMMPSTDTDLSYHISATSSAGESIEKDGVIENVQRAHEYRIRLRGTDSPDYGGSLIKVEIEDIPVIDESIEIFGRPMVAGVEFDIDQQVVATPGNFSDRIVSVRGFFSIASLVITEENGNPVVPGYASVNIANSADAQHSAMTVAGLTFDHMSKEDPETHVNIDEYYITFSKNYLDALATSDKEYRFSIIAKDNNGKMGKAVLRVANTDDAVEVLAPIGTAEAPDPERNPMAVLGTNATIEGYVYGEEATNFGIAYREAGTSAWTYVPASGSQTNAAKRKLRGVSRVTTATRADKVTFSVKITGLTPGTTYEYRTYADGWDNLPVSTFTTEGKYIIPNASMETWDTYSASTLLGTKNVTFPGSGSRSFWDSGNEGAATANMTLTDKSTDMVGSGKYSARLESKSAMGVIAAGNLFIGSYVRTDGTNGVLSLGRTYNQSHPSKMVMLAHYRPASGVSIKSGNEGYVEVTSGGTDHGQVYIALSTEPIEIRTNPNDRKLFDTEDPAVIAYGQVTWKEAFGPDGALQRLEIPFTYNDRAKTKRPKYLIMVASASKFGDYFSGAKGSVMYLDDFELVYE